MTADAATAVTTQVHRVYIRATPEAVWNAITKPEWTARYGYGGYAEYDALQAGSPFRVRASEEFLAAGAPEIVIDGEVIEADPPRRLVQTWRMLMDSEMESEGFTRLTSEIEPASTGTKLTVIHELEGAPRLAAMVAGEHEAEGAGGGWAWVLSDLKSVLETGTRIAG